MGSFVIYILEWALSLLVLLLIWKLAFAGTTLHRFNRFYLLGATLVSALIPLAGIETEQAQALAIEGTRFATVLQQVDIEAIASDLTVNEMQTVSGDHVWAGACGRVCHVCGRACRGLDPFNAAYGPLPLNSPAKSLLFCPPIGVHATKSTLLRVP